VTGEERAARTAYELRRAQVDDVPAIMELERSIFVNDAWSERSMLSEVTGEHGYYLVAFDSESPDCLHRVEESRATSRPSRSRRTPGVADSGGSSCWP
jgi:hypothetical protein